MLSGNLCNNEFYNHLNYGGGAVFLSPLPLLLNLCL